MIVESLITGKRMATGSSMRISSLEDIAVFTKEGEMTLKEVLKKLYDHEKGGQAMDPKSDDRQVRQYFGIVVPDYNPEKVYLSDIRKMVSWYNLLQEKEMLDFSAEGEAPAEAAGEEAAASEEV